MSRNYAVVLLALVLTLYWAVSFLSMGRMPIAWLDETMFVDVSWNLAQTGILKSDQWGQPGTETHFYAYLPAGFWYQAPWLTMLGLSPFSSRFPFFMAGLSCCCLLLFFLKKRHGWGASLLLALFLFSEKSIMECLRNGRFEGLELLLYGLAWIVGYHGNRPRVTALCCGLMVLVHPVCWPVALVLGCQAFYASQGLKKIGTALLAILPTLYWLAFTGFCLTDFTDQFLSHGSDHSAFTAEGNLFYNHFIARFFPFGETQLLTLLMHLFAWVILMVQLKNTGLRKLPVSAWVFGITSLYYMLMAGPFPRYNPVLVMSIFWLVVDHLPMLLSRLRTWMIFAACILQLIPFSFRAWALSASWEIRNPESAMQHWQELIPLSKGKTLLIEGSLGYYIAKNSTRFEFTNRYALQKHPFERYDEVIWLSPVKADTSAACVFLGSDMSWSETNAHPYFKPSFTYRNSYIYQIKTKQAYAQLARMY